MNGLPEPRNDWSLRPGGDPRTAEPPVPAPAEPLPPQSLPLRPAAVAGRGRQRSTTVADIVGAVVGWLALLTVGAGSVFTTAFFPLAMATCTTGADCSDRVAPAMAVALIGTATGVLVALIGTIVCAMRGRLLFYWPLIGIATVVGAFLLGVYISGSGMAT